MNIRLPITCTGLAISMSLLCHLNVEAESAPVILSGPVVPTATDSQSFDNWAALVSTATTSPVNVEPGDYQKQWTAPDGRKVILVVKVPHPSDSTLSVTLPSVPEGDDARPYFEAALAKVRSEHAARLVIPKARYTFSSLPQSKLGHLILADLSDLTIEGNGATLIFSQDAPGLYVTTSSRIKLSQIDIEFSLHTASLATMVKQNQENVLVVDPRFPVSANDAIRYLSEYDPAAKNWVIGGQRVILPPDTSTPAVLIGNQTYRSDAFKAAQVGKTFMVFHHWYGGAGIKIEDKPGPHQSEDITLDGVSVHSAPGMGIVAYGLKRGLAVFHSSVTPKDDPASLMSSEYDAIHTLIVGGDVVIEGNKISGQGDDAINLNSPVSPVLKVSDDGKTVQLSTYSRFISASDSLAFFDTTGSYLGRATVVGIPKSLGGLTTEIALDRAPASISTATVARDIALTNNRVAVLRNNVSNCNCHGLLVQVPNVLVDGNVFSGLNYNAVRLLTNLGGFKEGVGAINVIVSNNQISGTGIDTSLPLPWAAISAYGALRNNVVSVNPMNKSLVITGNTIRNAAQGCITVASSSDVVVTKNVCESTNLSAKFQGKPSLVIQNSFNVKVLDNTKSGQLAGGISVDDASAQTATVQKSY